jgi:hypothetical protein
LRASDVQRYFFDVTDGHRLADASGMECKSDLEAIDFAHFIARQIAAETTSTVERWVTVLDCKGREIGRVPVHERSNEGFPAG